MYCSNCGTGLKKQVRFCPICGSALCGADQSPVCKSPTIKGPGELLYTTKGGYSAVGVVLWFALFAVGMIGYFSLYGDFAATGLGWVVSFIPMAIFILPLVNAGNMRRSHIEMYETVITGVALPDNIWMGRASEFTVSYSDIMNVEKQHGTVKFNFAGGSYVVQASKCEDEVISIFYRQKEYVTEQQRFMNWR